MHKQEIIEAIQEKTGEEISKKVIKEVIDTLMDVTMESVASGEEVRLTGFGTFKSAVRKARTGVNPRNPEEKIAIPEKVVPTFKAGKNFKDIVKG